MKTFDRTHGHILLTTIVLLGLAAGSVLHLAGNDIPAHLTWTGAVAIVLVPLGWSIARSVASGRVGVDVIALLAMVGALVMGEYLAGAVIALMLAGGNALEEFAQGRAGRELSVLVERAPKRARLLHEGEVSEVAAADITRGDIVIVRTGEIVPVDGILNEGLGILDQAALTGEPLPVQVAQGAAVLSGSTNAGNAIHVRAIRAASESTYGSIVRLVEQALARKAPMVRVADRFSVVFLVATAAIASLAWIATGDPLRALAVLVIATPCPLILAPPVALVAGTSRAARMGIIIKGSAAVERLGTTGAVLIDKTGTLTIGTPQVIRTTPSESSDAVAVLRLAGAVEQFSVHTLADAIVLAASATGPLEVPTEVTEHPGQGVQGVVATQRVIAGSAQLLRAAGVEIPETAHAHDIALVHVASAGEWVGTIELADHVREDANDLITRLRALGIEQIIMATGDDEPTARRVASELGIDTVHANCTSRDKLVLIDQLRKSTQSAVVMIGDGVNDAPALAAADVGIAMGSAGATAASQAAGAVIFGPRVALVADAIRIGRRSRRIALQSVVAGMTMSTIGMVVAAFGYLPPLYGAISQEIIDVAVILNALRALRVETHSDIGWAIP